MLATPAAGCVRAAFSTLKYQKIDRPPLVQKKIVPRLLTEQRKGFI
jgi:hypothetical protein